MYYGELQLSLIQNIHEHYAHHSFRTKTYTLGNPSGNVQISYKIGNYCPLIPSSGFAKSIDL